jgi:hypothetical protein
MNVCQVRQTTQVGSCLSGPDILLPRLLVLSTISDRQLGSSGKTERTRVEMIFRAQPRSLSRGSRRRLYLNSFALDRYKEDLDGLRNTASRYPRSRKSWKRDPSFHRSSFQRLSICHCFRNTTQDEQLKRCKQALQHAF